MSLKEPIEAQTFTSCDENTFIETADFLFPYLKDAIGDENKIIDVGTPWNLDIIYITFLDYSHSFPGRAGNMSGSASIWAQKNKESGKVRYIISLRTDRGYRLNEYEFWGTHHFPFILNMLFDNYASLMQEKLTCLGIVFPGFTKRFKQLMDIKDNIKRLEQQLIEEKELEKKKEDEFICEDFYRWTFIDEGPLIKFSGKEF